MTEVNGYDLFDEIENDDLKIHNRAAIMGNILEGGGMTPVAVGEAMKYLHAIPKLERKQVVARLAENMGVKV